MRNLMFSKATLDHARNLSENMRAADRDEVYAASGMSPFEGLATSMRFSPQSMTAFDAQGVVAMWGGAEIPGVEGVVRPWALAADRLTTTYRKDLARVVPEEIVMLRAKYALLENWVDARNVHCVKWLGRCGYTIHAAKPFGFSQLPFHKFTMPGER